MSLIWADDKSSCVVQYKDNYLNCYYLNCLSYSFWKDTKTEFLNDLIDGSIVSFRHVFLDYPTNDVKNPFKDLGSLEALTLFLDVNES